MGLEDQWHFLRQPTFSRSVDLPTGEADEEEGDVQWITNNTEPAQKWGFIPDGQGRYRIVSALGNQKFLMPKGDDEGDEIGFGKNTNNANILWRVMEGGGGTHLIRNEGTGMFLNGHIATNRIPNEADVKQTGNPGIATAHWVLEPAGPRLQGEAHDLEALTRTLDGEPRKVLLKYLAEWRGAKPAPARKK